MDVRVSLTVSTSPSKVARVSLTVSLALRTPAVRLPSAASAFVCASAPTFWVVSTTFSDTVFTKFSLTAASTALAAASVTLGAMEEGFSFT